jgi:2-succinyl-6-hydroxy-2,4-cyclohexadiene-1-carboxylate synthase
MATPLLFLHGFLGHPDDWKNCLDFLAYDGPVYSLTLPGHLSMGPPSVEDGFNDVSAYIKRYMDRLEISKCHIIGYSLGGRVAMHAVFKYPDLFESLTVLAASPGLYNVSEKQTRLAWDTLKVKQLRSKPLLQFLDEDWYSLSLFKEFRACEAFQVALTHRCEHDPENIAQTMMAMSPVLQPSFWKKLQHLSVPFTYIYGDNDSKYSGIANHLLETLRSDQIIGIADCGHVIHLEKPEELAHVLREIVKC